MHLALGSISTRTDHYVPLEAEDKIGSLFNAPLCPASFHQGLVTFCQRKGIAKTKTTKSKSGVIVELTFGVQYFHFCWVALPEGKEDFGVQLE